MLPEIVGNPGFSLKKKTQKYLCSILTNRILCDGYLGASIRCKCRRLAERCKQARDTYVTTLEVR